MKLYFSGFLISIWAVSAWAKAPTSQAVEMMPAPLLQISETEAFSKYVFLVDKETRTLAVFERNGEKIKKIDEYPADIGKAGGNKVREGDHKTPEGIYFLGEKLTQPKIPYSLYGTMAFTTNYPNLFDKRERKTGSGIWLHSVPDDVPLNRGSRGCVVVRNDNIKKLENYVTLGETPILIFDQVSYIPSTEHEARRASLKTFIENWRQAWESENIEKYMEYYDKEFKAPGGYNLKSWKRHKSNLKGKYSYIKIHLSQPYIVQHKDQLIVKTLQRYESDKHIDYGVKTIYALKVDGDYKIVSEEWTPFDQEKVLSAIAENKVPSSNVEKTQ